VQFTLLPTGAGESRVLTLDKINRNTCKAVRDGGNQ
jgi:hypothetical protein